MSNLKKTLALVLALALCFGVLAIGASAAYTDDAAIDDTYYEAVQTLSELNVINGEKNEDGTFAFRPTDKITRAEFCKILCVAMNGGVEPTLGDVKEFTFADTKDHWAAKYIEYLAGLNIVAGYDATTFGPDDYITAQQASKVILVALGYDAAFEQMVGAQWGSRADALANLKAWGDEHNAWGNLYYAFPAGYVTTTEITRELAAQMLYNAFGRNMVYYISAGEHGTVGVKAADGEQTFFAFYFRANVVDGIVIANTYGDVADRDNYTAKTTVVQGFYTNTGAALEYVTPAEYLGMAVRAAYYTTVRAGLTKYVVIGGVTPSEYNTVKTFSAPGLYSETDLGLKMASEVVCLYNYNYNSTYDAASGNDYFYLGNGMKATFIDNNDDGKVEFLQTVATHPYEITAIDSKTGDVTLDDLYTSADDAIKTYGTLTPVVKTGDSDKINKADFVYADGTAATIKKGDVVLAAAYGGKMWLADYTTFTGEIDKIATKTVKSGDYSWDTLTLTIDGEAYGIHDSTVVESNKKFTTNGYTWAKANALLTVGTELKFYADADGYVFYAEEIDSTYKYPQYALAIEADPIWQYSNGQPITLLFGDGTVEKVYASKIYDGTKFQTCSFAKGYWLNLTKNVTGGIADDTGFYANSTALVAYAQLSDDTYMIRPYRTADLIKTTTTDDVWTTLKNGSTKVFDAGGAAIPNIYTDKNTEFVNYDGAKALAYKGYANIPDWTLPASVDPAIGAAVTIFAVNDAMAFADFAIFNDDEARNSDKVGGKAGNARLITDLFVKGGEYTGGIASDAVNYFYIPDLTADSEEWTTEGGLKVVTYNNAVVNGIPGQKVTLAKTDAAAQDELASANISAASVDAKTRYKVTNVNSEDVVLKVTDSQILNNTNSGKKFVDYADNTTLSTDNNSNHNNGNETSYAITDKTVIINVKTNKAVDPEDINYGTHDGIADTEAADHDDFVLVITDPSAPEEALQIYVIPYNYAG